MKRMGLIIFIFRNPLQKCDNQIIATTGFPSFKCKSVKKNLRNVDTLSVSCLIFAGIWFLFHTKARLIV